jgi:hypothetical protein
MPTVKEPEAYQMFTKRYEYGNTRPQKLTLMGIRFLEGEEDAAPATPAPVPTPPAAVPTPPAATPAPVSTPAPAGKTYEQEYVTALREEAKSYRSEASQAKTATDTLTAENTALQAQVSLMQRTQAVTLASATLGANAALLLDSTSFTTEFATVDLNDADAVKATITAALEKNPAFKTGPTVPPSDGGGAHQGSRIPATPSSLSAAVAKALG